MNDEINTAEQIEKFFVDGYNYGKDTLKKISPDGEKELEDIADEIIDDTPDFSQQPTDFNGYWKMLRWILNLGFVAVPWTCSLIVFIFLNLFVNIDFNYFWAAGNFFLIFNTYYLFLQSFLSVWLVAEVPFWLRHFKPIRLFSLAAAFIYNVIYFAFFVDFIV